jgi:hypothetical protein
MVEQGDSLSPLLFNFPLQQHSKMEWEAITMFLNAWSPSSSKKKK